MKKDDLIIPKGNGLGWTININNPISWVVVIAFTLIFGAAIYYRIKQLFFFKNNEQQADK